jgi:hypothetical protein
MLLSHRTPGCTLDVDENRNLFHLVEDGSDQPAECDSKLFALKRPDQKEQVSIIHAYGYWSVAS